MVAEIVLIVVVVVVVVAVLLLLMLVVIKTRNFNRSIWNIGIIIIYNNLSYSSINNYQIEIFLLVVNLPLIIVLVVVILYSSPNIVRVIKSRRMRWAGHVARIGDERGCKGSWWGNRREWDHWGDLGVDGDNIRMDLQEVGCGYMDWIGLAQDRDRWRTLVSAVMNLWVPWNSASFLTTCRPVSSSRRTLHHGVSKY